MQSLGLANEPSASGQTKGPEVGGLAVVVVVVAGSVVVVVVGSVEYFKN